MVLVLDRVALSISETSLAQVCDFLDPTVSRVYTTLHEKQKKKHPVSSVGSFVGRNTVDERGQKRMCRLL